MNTTTSSAVVLPFRRSQEATSESPVNFDFREALKSTDEDRLRSIVESAVMNAYIQMQRLQPEESPFGPVFIERLQPDVVECEAVRMIMAGPIEDLSHLIHFDDDDE